MPNGGLTPDCVHCKHFRGRPRHDEDMFCTYHAINLPFPIRAFCAHFADLEPAGDVDWLDEVLDRSQLRDDMMYVWFGGYEVEFYYRVLAPISDYATWSTDTFMDALERLVDDDLPDGSPHDGKPDP